MSRLDEALQQARDTKRLELGRGAAARTAEVFRQQFGQRDAIVIADPNTLSAVGKHIILPSRCRSLILAPNLSAEWKLVEEIEAELRRQDAIPIAVGSGTINDLTKLAAHRAGRPYLCVATAASMDGYTAYGASITYNGSKQTFDCPAPRAVVADLDVLAAAPPSMNAAGYADLLAKMTAGADWIIADALEVEPIDPRAWATVQHRLREWTSDPAGVRAGDADAIARLSEGLMMSGFAMQAAQSSRPASGAEHQFSHLWDMQHHTHHGAAPSHGFKVGIGTLAVAALYEDLLSQPIEDLNVEAAVQAWPDEPTMERSLQRLFEPEELRTTALRETRAKWIHREQLRQHLELLKSRWPLLRKRLSDHLLPRARMRQMFAAAAAPTDSEQIGISPRRLRDSYRQALHIRCRYTILDLAERAALLDSSLDRISNSQP